MVLIEVKSITSMQRSSFRWGYFQKMKFGRTVEALCAKYPGSEIYGVFALVDYNKINFYYLDETQ